ncbi:MAG: hypothetical protein CMC08_07820 [Flavobacteriaceae bacterium]|nr:hypothetical protein [Flavobacteriaceae bacterium]
MQLQYTYLRKSSAGLFALLAILVLASCGTYNNGVNDADGIYSGTQDQQMEVAADDNYERANYYKQYFQSKESNYSEVPEEDVIFTDIEAYSTTESLDDEGYIVIEENDYQGYGGWGTNSDNVTVNVYNDGGWGYGAGWGLWNQPFWGGGYWGRGYWGAGYWGNPYWGWGNPWFGSYWNVGFGWGYPLYGGFYYPHFNNYPYYGYGNIAYNRGRRNTDYINNRNYNRGRQSYDRGRSGNDSRRSYSRTEAIRRATSNRNSRSFERSNRSNPSLFRKSRTIRPNTPARNDRNRRSIQRSASPRNSTINRSRGSSRSSGVSRSSGMRSSGAVRSSGASSRSGGASRGGGGRRGGGLN